MPCTMVAPQSWAGYQDHQIITYQGLNMSFDTFSDYLYLLRLSDSFICICISWRYPLQLRISSLKYQEPGQDIQKSPACGPNWIAKAWLALDWSAGDPRSLFPQNSKSSTGASLPTSIGCRWNWCSLNTMGISGEKTHETFTLEWTLLGELLWFGEVW